MIPGSDAEAEVWFQAAAKQGVVEAVNWLGVLFLHPVDEGRKPDAGAAVRLFQQAAEAGSAHAMANLGDAYLEGIGVEKNRETAKNFYLAGAAAGNVVARRRLFEEFGIVFDLKREQTVKEVAELLEPKDEAVSPGLPEASKKPKKLTSVELYAKLSPSVLQLYALNVVEETDAVSQGSAVAVTDTLAITNCHVIENKDAYAAKLRGKVTLFQYASGNQERDVCIIRAGDQLLPIEATRRYSDLKVGEQVYAIGSPKGLENTLSEGIISGLRKSDGTRYIQTTAPITHGSSGGGLFDDEGRLIGITTIAFESGSLNFAVAVDEALELLTDLR